jgi:peptide/nickel transport system ATP-binding protein
MSTTLEAHAVSRRFGGKHGHLALDEIDLAVTGTDAIGIVGESGSGKSTLARVMTGLDRPTSGEVLYNGRVVADLIRTKSGREEFYRNVQYIGQDTVSSFDPL